MKREIILIAHNLRSTHNVGSLLRTAEGLGVGKVYLSGYTPYPRVKNDSRLPYLADKIDHQIHKTALGAESMISWQTVEDITALINQLKHDKYEICALEQTDRSVALSAFRPAAKVALIVGREVEGLEPEIVALSDHVIEIPMSGHKESFNVVQAAAMALFHFRFSD